MCNTKPAHPCWDSAPHHIVSHGLWYCSHSICPAGTRPCSPFLVPQATSALGGLRLNSKWWWAGGGLPPNPPKVVVVPPNPHQCCTPACHNRKVARWLAAICSSNWSHALHPDATWLQNWDFLKIPNGVFVSSIEQNRLLSPPMRNLRTSS